MPNLSRQLVDELAQGGGKGVIDSFGMEIGTGDREERAKPEERS